MKRHLIAAVGLYLAAAIFAGPAAADPCLVVYPDGQCVYHYDPMEYYVVGPGDPLYDQMWDRGGYVLLELSSGEVDLSIYQAPGLQGFAQSTDGVDGYFFTGTDFNIIIDGFSNAPTTYVNILVKFDKTIPNGCMPTVLVNGSLIAGNTYQAGSLVVQTPTGYGNNYSDTMTLSVSWRGCYGLHVWAFSDANYNGVKDGEECFTAFSHDVQIPVEGRSWGAIKSLYR